MPAQSYWGATKPPAGVQLDRGHPLAQGLVFLVPFNEGAGVPRDLVRGLAGAPAGAPTWGGSTHGVAVKRSATTQLWNFGPSDWLPTTSATILFIRRKADVTLRDAVAWTVNDAAAGTLCRAYLPFSDGVAYFDFGGISGANRLTASGLSYPTLVEQWALVAGKRGSAIYRNGVLVGSQSTTVTRTSTTSDWIVGRALGSDLEDVLLVGVLNVEWTAAQVQAWSAQPYAMFAAPVWRRAFAPAAAEVAGTGSRPPRDDRNWSTRWRQTGRLGWGTGKLDEVA